MAMHKARTTAWKVWCFTLGCTLEIYGKSPGKQRKMVRTGDIGHKLTGRRDSD